VIAWGGSPVNNSLIGLQRLLTRPEWRDSSDGDRIRSALREQLSSPNTEARMLATDSLGLLFEQPELAVELRERLENEKDPQVQEMLLGELREFASRLPADADELLSALSSTNCIANIDFKPDEETDDFTRNYGSLGDRLIEVLLHLALTHQTPFAVATLSRWASGALEAPSTVGRIVALSRNYMKSRAPDPDDLQRRAFMFLHSVADVALAEPAQTRNDSRELGDYKRRRAKAATFVARAIATEAYFASGAFVGQSETDSDDRVPQRGFVDLALPLFERLAEVDDVATAHQLVQTLTFLSRVKPLEALLIMTTVVLGARGYEYESTGEEEIFKLFDRLVANDRDVLLQSEESLAGVRMMLGRYVDLGSGAAITQIRKFSEMF
jgi:hypothetical protein